MRIVCGRLPKPHLTVDYTNTSINTHILIYYMQNICTGTTGRSQNITALPVIYRNISPNLILT